MTCSYRVYGLRIQTNVPIPGLTPQAVKSEAEVRMSLGALPDFIAGIAPTDWQVHYISADLNERGAPMIRIWQVSGGDYFRIKFVDGTESVVHASGRKIWLTWPDSVPFDDVVTYLLGPVLGFVLCLRGTPCLHASAIAIGDRAVAFVGPSGSGKSTTAAAFARMGHPVLTDDILAIVDRGGEFEAQPAYPRIRLWPSSVEALFGAMPDLAFVTPDRDKRFLELNGGQYHFQPSPLPLSAIYLIEERSADLAEPRIESIDVRQGLMSLVANTYATNLLDKRMRAEEFQLLGRLYEKGVSIRRVIPSAKFEKLPALCHLIESDLLNSAACAPAF